MRLVAESYIGSDQIVSKTLSDSDTEPLLLHAPRSFQKALPQFIYLFIMTAAVAYHPVLLPAGVPVSMTSPNSSVPRSIDGLPSKARSTQSGKDAKVVRGRRERPCDACRKRKSKCVTIEGQNNVCAACGVHGQECTYIEDPQPRKRRLEGDGKEVDLSKRRLVKQPRV